MTDEEIHSRGHIGGVRDTDFVLTIVLSQTPSAGIAVRLVEEGLVIGAISRPIVLEPTDV